MDNKDLVVQCVNITTGEATIISVPCLLKQIKKNPFLLERHSYKVMKDPRSIYEFRMWIHPKRGGSDYSEVGSWRVSSLEKARTCVEKYLKRKSAVTDDYTLVSVNGKAVKS